MADPKTTEEAVDTYEVSEEEQFLRDLGIGPDGEHLGNGEMLDDGTVYQPVGPAS